MLQGTDIKSPDAQRPIHCKACSKVGIDKIMPAYKLFMHLGGAHRDPDKWTKHRYIEEFGDDELWERVLEKDLLLARGQQMRKINSERIVAKRAEREGIIGSLDTLVSSSRDDLTFEEQAFYDQFFETLLQQVDRDESQMPAISAFVFDIILVKRVRGRMLKGTKANSTWDTLLGVAELEKSLATAETRITKQMDKLGLSREAQQKRGAIIKSTPSAIISSYMDEIERMTPEMLDALKLDEQRVYNTMLTRIEKYILSEAPDLEQEEVSESVTLGAPLTLEQALAKAGLSVGGSLNHIPIVAASFEPSGADLPF